MVDNVKVLLNTTPSRVGGALQVASAFIMQALREPHGIQWAFATSRPTARELEKFGIELPPSLTVFERSPTLSLQSRRKLRALEAQIQPDCVLTLEGPAYVRFRSYHILGCSTAWVTHATWSAVQSLGSPLEWSICIGRNLYKGYWFRQASAWVAQTETARIGLARRLRLPIERIGLVLNSCGEHYLTQQTVRAFPKPESTLRILCFSFPHRHKNLRIIPIIARRLAEMRPNLKFCIVMTLPAEHPISQRVFADADRLGVTHLIENKGPIAVADGPDLYRSADICLLPTLLETFSATYPEAMAMGIPIVTTDLDFAHEVCNDAALYYSSRRPKCCRKMHFEAGRQPRALGASGESGKGSAKRLPHPLRTLQAIR